MVTNLILLSLIPYNSMTLFCEVPPLHVIDASDIHRLLLWVNGKRKRSETHASYILCKSTRLPGVHESGCDFEYWNVPQGLSNVLDRNMKTDRIICGHYVIFAQTKVNCLARRPHFECV